MLLARSIIPALLLAHALLALSFYWQPIDFWILFPVSLFVLTLFALTQTKLMVDGKPPFKSLAIGLSTGLGLYGFFAFGYWFIHVTGLPLIEQLEALYLLVKPTEIWHYVFLWMLIIPGEELFWRGYIVQKLSKEMTPFYAVLLGAILYASAHIYAGTVLLVVAALLGGILWGWIYLYTRNIAAAILSHLVFDLFLLVLLPLL